MIYRNFSSSIDENLKKYILQLNNSYLERWKQNKSKQVFFIKYFLFKFKSLYWIIYKLEGVLFAISPIFLLLLLLPIFIYI